MDGHNHKKTLIKTPIKTLSTYFSGLFYVAFKDFKTLMTSPIFFIVTTFCSGLWSYLFLRNLLSLSSLGRNVNLHFNLFLNHLSLINLIFIFIMPAITMTLIAQEKQTRTYSLLLTSPITSTQIVLGKFFSALAAACVIIFISLLYPLSASFFSDISWSLLFSSYLGLFFVTGIYVSVGLFSSSLTESIMFSVIMGVIFNLMLYLLSQGSGFSSGEIFTTFMKHVNLGEHFQQFIQGKITVPSLVFFLSVIGFFIFLTQRVVESSRWR